MDMFRCQARAGPLRQAHRLRHQAGGGVRGEQPYQEPRDAESSPHSRSYLQVRYLLLIGRHPRRWEQRPMRRPRSEDEAELPCPALHPECQSVNGNRHLNIKKLNSFIPAAAVRRKVVAIGTRPRQTPWSVTGEREFSPIFLVFHSNFPSAIFCS